MGRIAGEELKRALRLYAITDRHWLGGRSLAAVVEESLLGGVSLVQLREKELSGEELRELAEELCTLCHAYGVPLVVNDAVELAMATGADGVHVGQRDLARWNALAEEEGLSSGLALLRKRLGEDKLIGVSARTVEQALSAQAQGADYLGAGAVFPTGTKADASVLARETLQEICAAVHIPVVAIGGITAENVSRLAGSGISGVAVISAIYAQAVIAQAAKRLRQQI